MITPTISKESPLQYVMRTNADLKKYEHVPFAIDSLSEVDFAKECPPGTEIVINYHHRYEAKDGVEAIGIALILKRDFDKKAFKEWKSLGAKLN